MNPRDHLPKTANEADGFSCIAGAVLGVVFIICVTAYEIAKLFAPHN